MSSQAKPAATHLKEARGAGLNDLKAATVANAKFRHSPNPGRIAANLSHVGPFAGREQFDG
jgi:hypothetical protein